MSCFSWATVFYKNGVIGNAGLLVYAAVIGFTPIILAALGSRFFKPESLRPTQWSTGPRNSSGNRKEVILKFSKSLFYCLGMAAARRELKPQGS